jgi:hypothetical protein
MRFLTTVTRVTLAVLVVIGVSGWVSAQEPAPPQPAPTAAPVAAPQPAPTAAPVEATAPAIFVEAVRLELNGKAQYAGTVSMQFTAHGRVPKLVSVEAIPKMSAGDLAEDLYKELTLAAGSDYKVKSSGSRVTIEKANKKAPNVSLKITMQSILGVSFLIEKD